MEAAGSSSLLTFSSNSKTLCKNRLVKGSSISTVTLPPVIRKRKLTARIAFAAINDVPAAADSGQVEVTWQIVVGAIAGVTPFVVAGIEFSKRIIAQRRCDACGGSGLVLREKEYFRCPQCGGFLPWQSWKRFFSG